MITIDINRRKKKNSTSEPHYLILTSEVYYLIN